MREKDEFPATGCDQREVNAINHVWLRSKTNDSAQNHLIPVPPYTIVILFCTTTSIVLTYIFTFCVHVDCRWRRFNLAARQTHDQHITQPKR